MRRLALALLVFGLAARAAAQTAMFPARSGESGLLDVPDAEVVGVARGHLATELRLDGRQRGDVGFGPLPLYAGAGLSSRLELGLSVRDGGQPGDPLPARTLFGGAVKLNLIDGSRALASIGVDGYVDRLNAEAVAGGRALISTSARFAVRVAAFGGYEAGGGDRGPTYGGALSLAVTPLTAVVLEALGGPRGANYGGAVRHRVWEKIPVSLSYNYFPGDGAWRVAFGLSFAPASRRHVAETAATAPAPAAPAAPADAAIPRFTDDRPRFRLTMRTRDPATDHRSLRHGPWAPTGTGGASAPGSVAAPAPRTPSLEELSDAQLRDQESLADARERRVRATAEQLDAREKTADAERRKLADQERDVAARDQQLETRERRLGRFPATTPQQRDLEALDTQLAAQERNLGAQERSYGPPLDAAEGRVRDAAALEDAERAEANRLAASVSGAGSRAQQLEIRKQALGARTRQLAALEARLVARGERIDALERQLRTRTERLDVWQRRLDARSERIDLLEKRAGEPKPQVPAPARAAEPKAEAPKDKAVFVMVVKSPTAIVKERGAAPAAPTGVSAGIQPGVAVEKAVAAATIVTFPSPAAQLSELDREAIDNIAKLAAKESCELLIWARAKDPSLMSEAQRRAAEIRMRVLSVSGLVEKQVVTRITTRPGANGVDVVVSALRESSAKAAPSAAAPAARGAANLEAGEAGKRQIREAVQAAQPTIEVCIADVMEQRKLARAEGTMRLTVSPAGKVTKVLTSGADIQGGGLAECLGPASGSWTFPTSDAEYSVDVPITVIRGESR